MEGHMSNAIPTNLSFEGKVALVTGAAQGIGLATAQAFAAAGAAVVMADANEAAARSCAEQLLASGHKAMAVRCDVADEAQVKAMLDKAVFVSGGWMRRSTMPACRLLPWRPPTPAATNSIAPSRSISAASGAA